jgi:Snf7
MLQVLKQKRLYENQRDQLYNQQFNVEQTSFMMENVQDSVQTVQAMKAAGERGLRAFKLYSSTYCTLPPPYTDMPSAVSIDTCREGAPHRLQAGRAQHQQHRQAAG